MDKFRSENRFGNQQRSKLKSLSSTALRDCQIEAESLRKCLSDIAYIRKLRLEKRMHARGGSGSNQHEHRSPGAAPTIRRGALMVLLQQSANTLPLFIPKIGEQPPPLCGAMPQLPAYICESGSAVAALVKGDDENWILAEVISYNVRIFF
jgi:SAGA-associated factor 29